MKLLICACAFLMVTHHCLAQQHVYQIRADSVHIFNTCDTAELILENRTKDIPGFLYNKGQGRTEFRRLDLQSLSANRLAIAGQDTVTLSFASLGPAPLKDFYLNKPTTGLPVGTYEDLFSCNIPAGTLSAVGDKIWATYMGEVIPNFTERKFIAVMIEGTRTTVELPVTTATTNWKADVVIMRTGASTARLVFSINRFVTTASSTQIIDLSGLNFNSQLQCTLQAAGGTVVGGITAQLGTVKFESAAAQ